MIAKPYITDLVIYESPDRYTEDMPLLIFDSRVTWRGAEFDEPVVKGWDVIMRLPNTGDAENAVEELMINMTLEDAAELRDFLTRVLAENTEKEGVKE